jgi:transposase
MISPPPGATIYLVTTPCDMRKGMNGLAGVVQSALKANPHSGALYVFRGKRGDLVKILGWDGSGLCLFIKRLEEGRFVWPPIVAGRLKLTPGQLSLLLEGIDWRRTVAPATIEAPEMI